MKISRVMKIGYIITLIYELTTPSTFIVNLFLSEDDDIYIFLVIGRIYPRGSRGYVNVAQRWWLVRPIGRQDDEYASFSHESF